MFNSFKVTTHCNHLRKKVKLAALNDHMSISYSMNENVTQQFQAPHLFI